jgi:hypothetical protein
VFVCFSFFETSQPRLTLKSRSSCLSLPNAAVTCVSHHAQLISSLIIYIQASIYLMKDIYAFVYFFISLNFEKWYYPIFTDKET